MDRALFLWDLDDAQNHLLRFYVFGWLIHHGVWYPRWAPDLFMGYGFPVFNYYAPGLYYLGFGLSSLLRLSPWETFRATGFVAVLLGVSGAYALGVALWRRRSAGVLASVALLYAPYAFQLNLYNRGDIPEALGLSLQPWLLLATWRIWHAPTTRSRMPWIAAVAAIGAATLLVHNLTAIVTAAFVGVWVLALFIARPSCDALLAVAIAGLLAIGSTAFFWLPALGETGAVDLHYLLRKDGHDYRPGLIDPSGRTPNSDPRAALSPQTRVGLIDLNLHYPHRIVPAPKLSLGQAVLAALAVAVATGVGVQGRALAAAGLALIAAVAATSLHLNVAVSSFPFPSPTLGCIAIGVLAACGLAMAAQRRRPSPLFPLLSFGTVCWLLTFLVSEPLWANVPGLAFLQFPSRLMGPIAICIAIADAGAVAILASAAERRWGASGRLLRWGLTTIALAGLIFNGLGGRSIDRAPPYPIVDIGAAALASNETEQIGLGSTTDREFTPRDVQIAYIPDIPGYDRNLWQRLYPEPEWVGGLFYPLAGDLRFVGWRADQLTIRARVVNEAGQPGTIGVRQLYFPGWRAWIDGRTAPIGVAPDVPEQQANLGFMTVQVPPGEHDVLLRFGPTTPRVLGIGLTLATLAAAGAVALWYACQTSSMPVWPTVLGVTFTLAAAGYGGWRELRAAFPSAVPPLTLPATTARGVWSVEEHQGARGELVVNLAEAIRANGSKTERSSTGQNAWNVGMLTVKNTYDPGLGVAGVSRRQWLYMRAHGAASIDVALPKAPEVWFQAMLAADPTAWMDMPATPPRPPTPPMPAVEFRTLLTPLSGAEASAATSDAPITLLSRSIEPARRLEDRRWVPVEANLARWSGQTVRLTLQIARQTDDGADVAGGAPVAAGWGNPVIVAGETARGHRYPASD
jgi:hypothetical protein